MLNGKGEEIESAGPGTPVSVNGWRDLPTAGDQLLEAIKGEEEAKKAIRNRIREAEQRQLNADVEVINVKRREEKAAHEARTEEIKAVKESGGNVFLARIEVARREKTEAERNGIKELRLVIKGDVSGTVEAVQGALEGIGNKEARVKIVHTGVGEVNESDVDLAQAAEGESIHLV
jgi:translation initiation factor IF-2